MSTIKTKQQINQKIKQQKVNFSLEAAAAKEVILMGDFNNWSLKKNPMQTDGNGAWTTEVMLSPGKYEYKFLIDGDWRQDPRNNQTCPNCFGTQNSVLDLTLT
jgi:1,4-alpha-glucan branching enzyme